MDSVQSMQLIGISRAAKLFDCKSRDLKQLLADNGVPVVRLSERRRAVRISHLQKLLQARKMAGA